MEKIDMDYKQRNEFKNLGWISVKPFNRDVAPLMLDIIRLPE